ncbi:hypothetical protein [Microtetraspora malaysiensis]|uniref:hypothetical protein n=1 Tax=Microtetraspora malaysiensis TaxID=161358 RepID=UPI003D8CA93E
MRHPTTGATGGSGTIAARLVTIRPAGLALKLGVPVVASAQMWKPSPNTRRAVPIDVIPAWRGLDQTSESET